MSLSDPFCVDRYRDEFLDLMRSGTVDIVFANEDEAKSLYQTADLETAREALAEDCKIAIVTRSEKGSMIINGSGTHTRIDADAVDRLVDTTGAGDLYAAGFLYGYTAGMDMLEPLTVKDVKGDHFALGAAERIDLSQMDVVLLRQDPPFDMACSIN